MRRTTSAHRYPSPKKLSLLAPPSIPPLPAPPHLPAAQKYFLAYLAQGYFVRKEKAFYIKREHKKEKTRKVVRVKVTNIF